MTSVTDTKSETNLFLSYNPKNEIQSFNQYQTNYTLPKLKTKWTENDIIALNFGSHISLTQRRAELAAARPSNFLEVMRLHQESHTEPQALDQTYKTKLRAEIQKNPKDWEKYQEAQIRFSHNSQIHLTMISANFNDNLSTVISSDTALPEGTEAKDKLINSETAKNDTFDFFLSFLQALYTPFLDLRDLKEDDQSEFAQFLRLLEKELPQIPPQQDPLLSILNLSFLEDIEDEAKPDLSESADSVSDVSTSDASTASSSSVSKASGDEWSDEDSRVALQPVSASGEVPITLAAYADMKASAPVVESKSDPEPESDSVTSAVATSSTSSTSSLPAPIAAETDKTNSQLFHRVRDGFSGKRRALEQAFKDQQAVILQQFEERKAIIVEKVAQKMTEHGHHLNSRKNGFVMAFFILLLAGFYAYMTVIPEEYGPRKV